MARNGGHSGDGLHDLDFLRRIQRVHIDLRIKLDAEADLRDGKICEF